MALPTPTNCLFFPLLALLKVSSRCKLQPEGPWEECIQAAGALRSTALTVPALWIIVAAAFPALSTPMKVRLQLEGGQWTEVGEWRLWRWVGAA